MNRRIIAEQEVLKHSSNQITYLLHKLHRWCLGGTFLEQFVQRVCGHAQQLDSGDHQEWHRLQRDVRSLFDELRLGCFDGTHHLFADFLAVHEQEVIIRLQVQRRTVKGDVRYLLRLIEGDVLRLGQAHLQVVPIGARFQFVGRFERLRQFSGAGHTLRAAARRDSHQRVWLHGYCRPIARQGRDDKGFVQCIGQIHCRSHAGAQRVADQPRQFQNRPALGRGAEAALVGNAFLVKRQHVGHRRPRIQKGDGRVAGIARFESPQSGKVGSRQPRQHRFQEGGVRTDAVRKRGQTRSVGRWQRRQFLNAFAAAAGTACVHRPPPIFNLKVPCSGKLGSLSSCATSNGPSRRMPSSRSPWSPSPRRCSIVTWTLSTPGTA